MSLSVLDTDILTLYREGHTTVCQRVAAHSPNELAVTVISVEEQLSGWYRLLRRARRRDQLAHAYARLQETVQFFADIRILPFTEPAIERFEGFRKLKLGVGGMDLRIAAIAVEHQAIVVTRNVRDFGCIPGVLVEDWSQ